MGTIDRPLWTLEMDPGNYTPPRDALFIYSSAYEARALHDKSFFDRCRQNNVKVLRVQADGDEDVHIHDASVSQRLWLYDWGEISSFFTKEKHSVIILDVTGMTHRIWAPLLGSLLTTGAILHLVYTEPKAYRREEDSKFFNLSDRVEGIAPLPGFERIMPANRAVAPFVAMVGFEGPRLSYVMDQIETDRETVYPIIGLPGFQPGFHFQTYLANQSLLEPSRDKIRFAKANCPFDAFYTLEKIFESHDQGPLRIAPIGTKPHGIGAVLFALSKHELVELIYDHPLRSPERTIGEGKLCVYDISSFVMSSGFFPSAVS